MNKIIASTRRSHFVFQILVILPFPEPYLSASELKNSDNKTLDALNERLFISKDLVWESPEARGSGV